MGLQRLVNTFFRMAVGNMGYRLGPRQRRLLFIADGLLWRALF